MGAFVLVSEPAKTVSADRRSLTVTGAVSSTATELRDEIGLDLAVQPARERLVAGDQLRVAISGRYRFGLPARGANVHWTVHARPSGAVERLIAEQFTTLDRNGKLQITAATEPLLDTVAPVALREQDYLITVEVTDDMVGKTSQHAVVLVTPASFNLSGVVESEKQQLRLWAKDYQGKPVSTYLTLYFYRKLDRTAKNCSTDNEQCYRLLRKLRLATDSAGQVALTLPPLAPGAYRILAYAIDDRGNSMVWSANLGSSAANPFSDFSYPVTAKPGGSAAILPPRPKELPTDHRPIAKPEPEPNSVSSRLVMRLATPSFLVQGDRLGFTALVSNPAALRQEARLALDSQLLEVSGAIQRQLVIAPRQEQNVNWEIMALHPGTASLQLTLAGDTTRSRANATIPILPHGVPVGQVWSGELSRPVAIDFAVPDDALLETAQLSVDIAAGSRAILLAGLSYMTQASWSGTEQIASRLLAVSRILRLLPELKLRQRLQYLLEQDTRTLLELQDDEGAWGCWSGTSGMPEQTAYVLQALGGARDVGIAVPRSAIERSLVFLRRSLVSNLTAKPLEDPHLLAVVLWGMGAWQASDSELRDRLWSERAHLGASGAALLAELLAASGDPRALHALAQLGDLAKTTSSGIYWRDNKPKRWLGTEVETTAHAIAAFLALDPQNQLLPLSERWLALARYGKQWRTTRDTAAALSALAGMAKFNRRSDRRTFPPVGLALDGKPLANIPVDRLMRESSNLELFGQQLPYGRHRLTLSAVDQEFNCTFAITLRYQQFAERIPPRPHHRLTIRRKYELSSASTLAGGPAEYLLKIAGLLNRSVGDGIRVGDRLWSELEVEVHDDLRFVSITDYFPAGALLIERLSRQSFPP
ncbi:MAG: hypothetical protein HY692_00985, partial [Cyanobacteria bacterium NC_groundwater_1444_Ag_S-0.65um_54_12]|nr:hypothetical protein [Cyanobacteria bacterium NC_groundwater_1444_Ag_S-0.65um_54_12]